jgi:hypothetical protein
MGFKKNYMWEVKPMALPYGSFHNASCSAQWQIQWQFYYTIDDLDEIMGAFVLDFFENRFCKVI